MGLEHPSSPSWPVQIFCFFVIVWCFRIVCFIVFWTIVSSFSDVSYVCFCFVLTCLCF